LTEGLGGAFQILRRFVIAVAAEVGQDSVCGRGKRHEVLGGLKRHAESFVMACEQGLFDRPQDSPGGAGNRPKRG